MKSFLLWTSVFLSFAGQAQDERFFRRILSGDLIEAERGEVKEKTYHFVSKTPLYEIDLNRDGKSEALAYEIKDGEHWLHIYSGLGAKKILFSQKLEVAGKEATLFKIAVRDVSPSVRVMLLFFYEGNSQYLEFNGTGRIYMVTWEHDDLKTLSMTQGPAFWQEREERNRGYYQRKYEVELFDFNKDNIKEIVVKHGFITRVLMYLGKGNWRQL